MNKRSTGAVFCAIAAFLFAARYLAAAIFGSGVTSWNSELFVAMLSYMGPGLLIAAGVSLVVGVAYLIWAEKKSE